MFKRLLGVALAAAVLGGAGVAVQTTAQAPPASAGIGYWSYGCNPNYQWHQYPSEVNWAFRLSRNPANQPVYFIQHALRRMYGMNNNECGGLGGLTSNEYTQTRSRGYGWAQQTQNGELWWDADNCNDSYIRYRDFFNGGFGPASYGYCSAR